MAIERRLIEDVAAWAGQWLAFRRQSAGFPGLQFAIAQRGEILATGADGVASCETGEALRDDHLFRVASHSKTFTATLLLQLSEGRAPALCLDDRVDAHLPELASVPGAGALADARVGELASHGAGITRDGVDGDYWQLAHAFPTAAELLDLLGRSPAPYPPGERFHYSNVAYSLLGLILERVADAPYADLVAERIAAPLGLADTAADYVEQWASRYAAGHSHALGGLARVRIAHVATEAMAPATGVTSTAADLVRFYGALGDLDGALLGAAAKRRMRHVHWTTRENEGYGLGLQTFALGDRVLIGHSGGYPGHITRTWCDPESGVSVAVLTNAINAPASALATGIFRLIDRLARRHRDRPAAPAALAPESFAGRFASLWGAFDLAVFDGRLYEIDLASDDPTAGLGELDPLDEARLSFSAAPDGYASEGEPFEIERDAAGVPLAVRGGSGMTARRLAAYADDVAQRRVVERPR